jgi:adenosylhomocysteinase
VEYRVADLSLAEFGRKEITLAEHEMPGLMAIRAEYADAQPLKGARIMGSLHMTDPDRGAHRDARRARRRRALVSCNIFSTQDHAAAAIVVGPEGTTDDPRACRCSPGRARRSRSTGGAPSRRCAGPTAKGPNMILDDGGDATLLVHKGTEFEGRCEVPEPHESDSDEWKVVLDLLSKSSRRTRPLDRSAGGILGVTEETTTGVHRLYQMRGDGSCCSRRSTSTTRSPSRSSTTSTAAVTR